MYADMDWVAMSLAERVAPTKALYRAFAVVAKRQGVKRDILLFEALGDAAPSGIDYFNNFSKGQMDRYKAKDLHLWLAQNHFAIVSEADPNLFPYEPVDPFQAFIDRHAITGRLNIIRLKERMGIVQRADEASDTTTTLRLTERFCFEVDTALSGVALAFQRYSGVWHPLSLGADKRRRKADVQTGTNLLPRAADGHPLPLHESDDTGSHQFAVLISENRALPETQHHLAKIDEDEQAFEVHIVDVMIVT